MYESFIDSYYINCSNYQSIVNDTSFTYDCFMEINTRPNCPILRVTDIVWDKWSLLIMRNLLLDGPHRFQDFINALEGIGPTTLSKRLKSLEHHQLVKRSVLEGRPPRTKYELTELGLKAKPMIRAILKFGTELPPLK